MLQTFYSPFTRFECLAADNSVQRSKTFTSHTEWDRLGFLLLFIKLLTCQKHPKPAGAPWDGRCYFSAQPCGKAWAGRTWGGREIWPGQCGCSSQFSRKCRPSADGWNCNRRQVCHFKALRFSEPSSYRTELRCRGFSSCSWTGSLERSRRLWR